MKNIGDKGKTIMEEISRKDFIKTTSLVMGGGIMLSSLPIKGLDKWDNGKKTCLNISGRYPHLAMFNHGGECGIGAVVPWADRLWAVTYSPHHPYGNDHDGLYEITQNLDIIKRKESIGGTPANRMIHRESNQLFIGPYAIDKDRNVRPIPYDKMPGRPTANARHLTQPADKIYYMTMEEGMYEIDVKTLEVNTLYRDQNVAPGQSGQQDDPGYTGYRSMGGERLPGYHGKGGYTGQGHVIYANNGRIGGGDMTDFTLPSGCLASWDGEDEEWQVIENRQFTEVTGPGGIYGNMNEEDPLWSLGWDYRSLILKICEDGEWDTFRLPKGDYSYEGLHGWHTEWPRIRQVGPDGQYLMNHHGMWFEFFGDFSGNNYRAPAPIASHLKISGDFARWNDKLVFACDDAALSTFGEWESLVGQSQSNLWFTKWEDLKNNGRPYGFGGPWLHDSIEAGTPSDSYSFKGFSNRQLHISHKNRYGISFAVEIDRRGSGNWEKLTEINIPPFGYVHHSFSEGLEAEWIRLIPNKGGKYVTAYFHFGTGGGVIHNPDLFQALAPAAPDVPRNVGLVRPRGEDRGTLEFAAWTVNSKNQAKEAGYYEIGEDMNLHRVKDPQAHKKLKEEAGIDTPEFTVDLASVIVKDQNGRPYRLPKGDSAFDSATDFGWPRNRREVVTERDLFNAHGILYYLPRPNSGGIAHIKPITTHNKRITDFCSWRGMLVLAGCQNNISDESEHFFKSDDDKVGLWAGDVDDLWKLGKPTGIGGPWKNAKVYAGNPSEPYLMTGFDEKILTLSHDIDSPVRFDIEIDFAMNVDMVGDDYNRWHKFKKITVEPGQSKEFKFPKGFSAHWVRLKANKECRASAIFIYN
ncbi:hypothetical protein SAMN05443144_1142 [Fodinibius roseus]|uniref:Uncharacterized protein n=2 Tax=Fodinibius roseus TaxID=1194090 RepID=A0A1M5EYQ6_9BACT|nr:hypothetical protein SAMN05443144_1142 [Fodinibius roseus]